MEYLSTYKYSAVGHNNQLLDRLLHGCSNRAMLKAIVAVGEELHLEDAVKVVLQHETKIRSLKVLSTLSCEELEELNVVFKNCWRCENRHQQEKCHCEQERCTSVVKLGTTWLLSQPSR